MQILLHCVLSPITLFCLKVAFVNLSEEILNMILKVIICFRVPEGLEVNMFSITHVIAMCIESQHKHPFVEREKIKETIHTANTHVLFYMQGVFTRSRCL